MVASMPQRESACGDRRADFRFNEWRTYRRATGTRTRTRGGVDKLLSCNSPEGRRATWQLTIVRGLASVRMYVLSVTILLSPGQILGRGAHRRNLLVINTAVRMQPYRRRPRRTRVIAFAARTRMGRSFPSKRAAMCAPTANDEVSTKWEDERFVLGSF